jgi:hypothetical protein
MVANFTNGCDGDGATDLDNLASHENGFHIAAHIYIRYTHMIWAGHTHNQLTMN